MHEYLELLSLLEKWESGGKLILNNGTKLICRTPHIGSQAWLHEIYHPLTNDQILNIQKKFKSKIPSDFIEYLKVANGLNVFSDTLSIWGLRTSYKRNGDETYQPYDLFFENEEMKGLFSNNWLMFGSYSWDGSTMAYDLDSNSNKVFLCNPDSFQKLKEWDSLLSWINSEIQRLSSLFDENGILYNKDVCTVPIN